MSILIQNKTTDSIRRNKDVKTLPAILTISNIHNHNVDSAEALRQLRVLPHTKQKFYDYFNQGVL